MNLKMDNKMIVPYVLKCLHKMIEHAEAQNEPPANGSVAGATVAATPPGLTAEQRARMEASKAAALARLRGS